MSQMRLEESGPQWEPEDKQCEICGNQQTWEQIRSTSGFLRCEVCRSSTLRRKGEK